MTCPYGELCNSCTLLDIPYPRQLEDKQTTVAKMLALGPDCQWLPPVSSKAFGFRNKAKLAVGGLTGSPVFGITDSRGRGVDLRNCPLYVEAIERAIPGIAAFVEQLRLEPYDMARRRGELKYVVVSAGGSGVGGAGEVGKVGGELMLRFVLRSRRYVALLGRELGRLRALVPGVRVVSVNLLPEHKAAFQGDEEILLSEESMLPVHVATSWEDLPLFVSSGSFFQTNTEVAGALYGQCREWVSSLPVVKEGEIWDLFCGVGGFGLACAGLGRAVLGIESSKEAVACAKAGAEKLRNSNPGVRVEFLDGDALQVADSLLAQGRQPEVLVVNPPRRGLGADLCGWIEDCKPAFVVYSSCDPASLARDLADLPGYQAVRARVFDMFPNTNHTETMVLLSSSNSG
ncbi:MAG: hypothetical protein Q4G30_02360 [Actinomycetaceae bacterium]|nr:hypothetical protein [Actinomycetaceae bacterium]